MPIYRMLDRSKSSAGEIECRASNYRLVRENHVLTIPLRRQVELIEGGRTPQLFPSGTRELRKPDGLSSSI